MALAEPEPAQYVRSVAAASDNRALTRQNRALTSTVFLSGAGEVVDFLLPLFAGAAMGLTPSQIGILMAVEIAVSLVMRPLAGSLADRFERRNVAALGALLYAVSCAGYAVAFDPGMAFAAAAIGGAGGSVLWVALRALIGERLADDSGVYAKLVAAEENGSWLILVPALFLISIVGYRGVFTALAVCCVVGAVVLLSTPRNPGSQPADPGERETNGKAGKPRLFRKLSPMLLAVALTMVAESAISLLMLMHLQREFGLDPLEVGMVFAPGAIVMGILPTYLHGVESRHGRTRVLAVASVFSAIFAVSLAFAPTPLIISLFWVLSGVAWAVMLPVQQAVIAEVSGRERLGRGLGWFESASLAGALVASIAAGYLYELGSWQIACFVAAAVILAGAVLVPAAVRVIGAAEYPSEPEPLELYEDDGDEHDDDDERAATDEEEDDEKEQTRGELVGSFVWHTGILLGALAIAHLFVDAINIRQVFTLPSVPPDPLTFEVTEGWMERPMAWVEEVGNLIGQLGGWIGGLAEWIVEMFDGLHSFVFAFQIWIVVWIMDLLSTLWYLPTAPRSREEDE